MRGLSRSFVRSIAKKKRAEVRRVSVTRGKVTRRRVQQLPAAVPTGETVPAVFRNNGRSRRTRAKARGVEQRLLIGKRFARGSHTIQPDR
jgi:hypothetical protein